MLISAGRPMRLKRLLQTLALAICGTVVSTAHAATSNYIPVAVNSTTTTLYGNSSTSTTPGRVGVDKAGNVFFINHPSSGTATLYEIPASAPTTQVPLLSGLALTGSNAAFVDASGALWVTVDNSSLTLAVIPASSGIPNTALVTGISGYSSTTGLAVTNTAVATCSSTATPTTLCAYGTNIASTVTGGYVNMIVDVYSDGAGNIIALDAYDTTSAGGYDRIIRFSTSAATTGYLLADKLSQGVGNQNTVAQIAVAGDGNVYWVDSTTHSGATGYTYLVGAATATTSATPTRVGNTSSIGSTVQIASAVGLSTDPWGNLVISGTTSIAEVPLESGALNFADEFLLVYATGQASAQFPIAGTANNIREGGSFDSHGNYYFASAYNVNLVQIGSFNFGSASIGTLVSPASYSTPLSIDLTFNISASNAYHVWPTYTMTNLGSTSLYQSFPYNNKGFTGGSTLNATNPQYIQMNFQPAHAGQLKGGYIPLNNSPNLAGVSNMPWTTVNLIGTGLGPQPFFLPGTASAMVGLSGASVTPTASLYTSSAVSTAATKFAPAGIALDTYGDIFVADTSNKTVNVYCLASTATAATSILNTGTQTGIYCDSHGGYAYQLSNTFVNPVAVAIDGANTIFVLDADSTGSPLTRLTSSVTTAGTSSPFITTYALNPTILIPSGTTVGGTALSSPQGIALDAYGNVFIADTGNSRIIQAHPYGATYSQNIVYVPKATTFGGTALSGPTGLAVDASGNLFIADTGNNRIVEYSATGVASVISISGVTLSAPSGVQILPSGALVVTDKTNIATLIENGVATKLTFTTATSTTLNVSTPAGVALDLNGNVYISDPGNSRITQLNVNTPVTMPTFAATAVGANSADMGLYVHNVGTSALTFSAAPSITNTTNFAIDTALTTCSTSASVAAGSTCLLEVYLHPQVAGIVTSTATLADNVSSVSGFTAVSFGYTGTFVSSSSQTATFSSPITPQTITFANPGAQTVGTPLTLVATSTSGLTVSFTSSTTGVCTVSGTTATFIATGSCTIVASQAGNSVYGSTSTSQTFTVNGTPQTITFANPGTQLYSKGMTMTLSATTSATGLSVSFASSTTSICTVSSTTLSILSTGTCTIVASQAGSTVYAAATSVTQSFAINYPVPTISDMSTTYVSWGTPTFTLTVNGTGFVPTSVVYWGSTALTTTYVSATQVTAVVQIFETDAEGIFSITAQNTTPGGGTSNAMQFEVDSQYTAPTPPSFTTSSVTVTAGSSASYPVTLPSTASNISITCLNLPTGAACSYASNAVSITTTSSTPKGTYQIAVVFTETLPGSVTISAFALAPFLLAPLFLFRRRLASKGTLLTICLFAMLMASATALIGCTGGTVKTSHQVTSTSGVTLIVQ